MTANTKGRPRTRTLLARSAGPGKHAAAPPAAAISLGSNLGDRRARLRAARAALAALHDGPGRPRVSALYETEPDGCPPGTPAFLNAVVEIRCRLTPHALLRRLRRIERLAGRPARRRRNAPRPLDLDLLCFGGARVRSRLLVLPHPRAAARRFVLQPLADLDPGFVLPGMRTPVVRLLAALPARPSVRRIARRW